MTTPPPPGSAAGAPRSISETDPWAGKLVRLLDELFRVPGTSRRIGIDGIVGLFLPGAGDAITAVGATSLLFLALKHRVPTVAIGRMVVNLAIDLFIGAVPVVGDLVDIFFKSNRRNLEIIERYRADPAAQPSRADYVLVGVGLALVAASVVIPVLVWSMFGAGVFALVRGLWGAGGGGP